MADDIDARARRQYLRLGTGELASVVVFASAGAWLVVPRFSTPGDARPFWLALLPLLFILTQAGLYWLLARSWVVRSRMPSRLASVFQTLRVINPLLIIGALVGVLLQPPTTVPLTVLVAIIWLFAAIEYVNYFVVRLSYPAPIWFSEVSRLRQTRLMKDIANAE